MDVTARYQLSLPLLLRSASPALSALHVARLRRVLPQEPTLQETHCQRCGSFLLDGLSEVRTATAKKRKVVSQKVLRKTCGSCGHVQLRPLELGNARLFPKAGRNFNGSSDRKEIATTPMRESESSDMAVISHSQTTDTVRSSSRDAAQSPRRSPSTEQKQSSSLPNAGPGKRPKKKSGLQELLAKNRERERQAQAKKDSSQSGLGAFMSGL
ncbi:hypothetical protein OE88DRAFT_1731569 [Heliocybe sulcata]|uniref:Rpr2-domain-containing protein n=1 Tax=Heliocybe sulcata TaxID=5364 RepID=A0A5C3NF02_9AGAM|nr:hypothetical protein OE88DRAFT_1731569 [Heliocybe sulcata]